eukprot:3642516-Pyramimonas_sp.AAC.1
MLVPMTPVVSAAASLPKSAVDLEHTFSDPKGNTVGLYLGYKLDCLGARPFVPPFWAVQPAPDSSCANMGPTKVYVNSTMTGFSFVKESPRMDHFTIPLMLNTKAVKAGAVLLHKPDSSTSGKRSQLATSSEAPQGKKGKS